MSRRLKREELLALSIPPERINVTEPSSMFSSITVHEFMYDSQKVVSATLPRAQSFPGAHYSAGHTPERRSSLNWAPAPIPATHARLEISLGEDISMGRIGLVYEVEVLRVVNSVTGEELRLSDFNLPPMCIKVAQPRHSRSLAREAWMYEQLLERDGYQGTIVPRCWGFFSANLNDLIEDNSGPHVIFPWSENEVKFDSEEDEPEAKNDPLEDDDEQSDDDDERTMSYSKDLVDVNGDKYRSPWNTWHYQSEHPIVSLILLERLGERYKTFSVPKTLESTRDLSEILDDLVSSGVWHRDTTFRNVLRASSDSTNICSRHKRKHEWRIIDFDRSLKIDPTYNERDLRRLASLYRCIPGGGAFNGEPP